MIKIQFQAILKRKFPVKLLKIHIKISDKGRSANSDELQNVVVEIQRDLKEKDSDVEGVILKPGGERKEHNILLYVEYLKAKVSGCIEYVELGPNADKTVKKINLEQFDLDLQKGQFFIKNKTFKEFWESVAEMEERMKNGQVSLTVQEL